MVTGRPLLQKSFLAKTQYETNDWTDYAIVSHTAEVGNIRKNKNRKPYRSRHEQGVVSIPMPQQPHTHGVGVVEPAPARPKVQAGKLSTLLFAARFVSVQRKNP